MSTIMTAEKILRTWKEIFWLVDHVQAEILDTSDSDYVISVKYADGTIMHSRSLHDGRYFLRCEYCYLFGK